MRKLNYMKDYLYAAIHFDGHARRTIFKQINFIIVLLLILLASSCGTPKQVIQYTPEVRTEYVEKLRDTTIYVPVPVEKIVNMTLDTVSRVETSVAVSDVIVDNGKLITHKIENKTTNIPTKIVYKDIYHHDTLTVVRTVYQDKLIEKTKIPVTYWIFLGWFILTICFLGIKIYLKLK